MPIKSKLYLRVGEVSRTQGNRQITASEIAAEAGLTRPTIHKYMNPRKRFNTVPTSMVIALITWFHGQGFNLTYEDLFEDDGDE